MTFATTRRMHAVSYLLSDRRGTRNPSLAWIAAPPLWNRGSPTTPRVIVLLLHHHQGSLVVSQTRAYHTYAHTQKSDKPDMDWRSVVVGAL